MTAMRARASMLARIIFLIFLALWSAFIFVRSSKTSDESSEESSQFIKMIARVIDRDFNKLPADKQDDCISNFQFIARKAAHFTAYAMLGALAAASALSFRKNPLSGYIYCIFYAASDEIHQRFVRGRSCELRDFLIDISGALLGILISVAAAAVCRRIYKKIKNRRLNKVK